MLAVAILLAVAACSTTSSQPMENPAKDFSGLWRGDIRVIPCSVGIMSGETGRCNAVNRITFSLRQSDSSLSGEYRCAIGTMVCRAANRTDYGTVVSGQVSGRDVTMRVMLPGDVSSCLYHGSETSPGEVRGTYRCYQGGGLVEVGIWQVRQGASEQYQPFVHPE